MSVSKAQTQVEWSSSDSSTVTTGSNATSDVVTIAAAAVAGSLQIKAEHSGTPASGDEIRAFVQYSNGDPDAAPDIADEFDTPEHVLPVILDTNSEDPAIRTIAINPSAKSFRLYVINDGASSIDVSAQYSEQTAD